MSRTPKLSKGRTVHRLLLSAAVLLTSFTWSTSLRAEDTGEVPWQGAKYLPFQGLSVEDSESASTGCMDCHTQTCLLYTSPSPRDGLLSRMPSSA